MYHYPKTNSAGVCAITYDALYYISQIIALQITKKRIIEIPKLRF